MPSRGRFPSSQLIELSDWHGLIDCGEGTQIQLTKFKIKRNRISHIFISHLHGDHVFGLPGLLGSFNHFNRTGPLTIYGPTGIRKLIDTIREVSGTHYNYPIQLIELDHTERGTIKLSNEITITHFPLKHRIPTIGYRFDYHQEKVNVDKAVIERHKLSVDEIKQIKEKKDIENVDGSILLWTEAAKETIIKKSYAYCSDTIYDPELVPYIQGVDYLYHETTYLDDMEKEASDRKHATLGQALKIAESANAKSLITGHYSSRYANLQGFYKYAESSTYNIIIGVEGLKIDL